MNNRSLIIIAVFVILVVIVGIFAFTLPHNNNADGKLKTQINFLSETTLKSGEAVQFELKDEKGNAIAGENITIKFEESGENQTYGILTDSEGKGSLVLNNEVPGTYVVYVSYNGSAAYYGSLASQTITIEEGVVQQDSSSNATESTSSEPLAGNSSAGTSLYNGNSTTSQNLHYDSQYNFYYDDNGVIRGGQSDGMSADYVRNSYESGDMIDEEGNLQ